MLNYLILKYQIIYTVENNVSTGQQNLLFLFKIGSRIKLSEIWVPYLYTTTKITTKTTV